MQVLSAVTLLSFLAAAVNGLTWVQPTAGSTISTGNFVTVQVDNDVGESYTSVQVTFASPCGYFTRNIPTGNAQSLYIPCDVSGPTSARASVSQGASATIQLTAVPNVGSPYPNCSPCASPCALPYGGCNTPCALPYGACNTPCANPCVNPCVNPCAKPCGRRSRRSAACNTPTINPITGTCGEIVTATPCDTIYCNQPLNFPVDCAPRCSRRRLYADGAEEVSAFNPEQQQSAEFIQQQEQQQVAVEQESN